MKDIEAIEFTLIKTRTYNLKPFGRFLIKWCPSQALAKKEHVIDFARVSFDSRAGMPYTDEQQKVITKYMLKHKTDVLTNGHEYFTMMGSNVVEITNDKIKRYASYLDQRELEDCSETWKNYLQRL